MRKTLSTVLLTLLCLLIFALPVRAEYVLPYPSFMPGNKVYKVTRVIDELRAYWYWGPLGKVKYHMALADKYLVEAKVLFEYKQYLLAVDALVRSDTHIREAPYWIERAAAEGKDVSRLKEIAIEEKLQHIKVLRSIQEQAPEEFTWTPEKSAPTQLPLHGMLDESIAARE